MGKKAKVGKQRKDKFYHLAKETGYRSRSAFKLIQLNRKYEFLQRSRVLVDLCAAPGGWMQAAVEHMPMSSLIVGVDLYPIKPISGCISITADITTPQCLQLLKKEMKTWKADVVLNDGAPNVGQNWLHDAYQQNLLTLSAAKLATELLRPGGYFVTKIFRSKDYNSLIWVFQQLFANVISTKPAASRHESAEIFVVCKGYLAPNSIDPKLLDPKYVFEEVEAPEGKKQLKHLLMEIGKKKKPGGYPTEETLLYRPITASEFIRSTDHVELLGNTSEIILDEDWIINNKKTTDDIKEYCKDVKVIGKKEIKALISWRKSLREKLEQYAKLKDEPETIEEEPDDDEDMSDTEKKLKESIEQIQENERKQERRKKKQMDKVRKKIEEKKSLDMIIPGDIGPTDTLEDSMFTLKSLKSAKDVDKVVVNPSMPEVEDEELDSEEELAVAMDKQRNKVVRFAKEDELLDDQGRYVKKYHSDSEEDSGKESMDEDDDEYEDPNLNKGLGIRGKSEFKTDTEFDIDEVAPVSQNPLLTDLDPTDSNTKRLRKAAMWFNKDIFKGLNDESDEDAEVDILAKAYAARGAQVSGLDDSNDVEMKDSTSKINKDTKKSKTKSKPQTTEMESDSEDDDLEIVPEPKKKKAKLDVKGLALATVMVQSKKAKRDLLDEGWNRYAFSDENLPDWFVEDEKKHMKKEAPVPSHLIEEYKNELKEINARPIKKVIEAKARKKKRTIRKLEKAKKKAESILENSEMTESEKTNQIKQLYKKANRNKKKEVTYVVSKKFNASKRAKRPNGVKGPFKVVDPRMKKDLRRQKAQMNAKTNRKGKRDSKRPQRKGKK